MALMQTQALVVDAYRELNARKMFWISMAITTLVIAVFAVFGYTSKGIEILWFEIEIPALAQNFLNREFFYKSLFQGLGLDIWLGWASTILAIVSTASLIPDFVSSGSIEGMLSKPIGRLRLFLTKYLCGLLFVLVQATYFCVGAFLVIGLRGGVWLWAIFAAIPLVTLFFSYLYCVSAMVGVWTRSTLAALIAALAVWGACLAVNLVEMTTLSFRLENDLPVPTLRADVESTTAQIEREKSNGASEDRIKQLENRLASVKEDVAEREKKSEEFAFYHRLAYAAKTILPKTAETKELTQRASMTEKEFDFMMKRAEEDQREAQRAWGGGGNVRTTRELMKIRRNRSAWWIIGTSMAFQGVVLGMACWIFTRKDF
jgi:ABC-type transport system involved in multi-copper enzyme maturation permease subunit